jgi:hypothetical protein
MSSSQVLSPMAPPPGRTPPPPLPLPLGSDQQAATAAYTLNRFTRSASARALRLI